MQTKNDFIKLLEEDPYLPSLQDFEKYSYYEHFYQHQELTIKELQIQQRYSMCLSIFAFFESKLKNICLELESSFNSNIKLKDLYAQDDLSVCYNFLIKVIGIENDRIEKFYTSLRNQKLIRNKIAHFNGLIPQNKKPNNIVGLRFIKNDDHYKIIIEDSKYLIDLISRLDKLFYNLLQVIDDKYTERIKG